MRQDEFLLYRKRCIYNNAWPRFDVHLFEDSQPVIAIQALIFESIWIIVKPEYN